MIDTTTMTVRLEKKLKNKLGKLAQSTKQSKSFLVTEAIEEFVARNEWQIKGIRAGLKAADEGRFATEKEMADIFDKHER